MILDVRHWSSDVTAATRRCFLQRDLLSAGYESLTFDLPAVTLNIISACLTFNRITFASRLRLHMNVTLSSSRWIKNSAAFCTPSLSHSPPRRRQPTDFFAYCVTAAASLFFLLRKTCVICIYVKYIERLLNDFNKRSEK